jgi:CubicO group peptidase (beta-lactamase class C family)
MSKTLISLLILLAIPVLALAQQAGTPTEAKNPAVRRASEVIRLIETGNRAEARKYVTDNFTPEMLGRGPMDRHLGFVSGTHDQMHGVELVGIKETGPTSAEARLKSKLTGSQWLLIVRTEADAPNRIAGLGLRPAPPEPGAPATKKMTDAEMAKELDAFMQKLAGADLFSGAVLLAKDGKPIYQKAFGTANKDFNAPNRIDTKFNLGSMNKMFTAVAIAQLVERGKLSFDDPLSKFLPDFPDKDSAEKIKIKQILTHTAGLGGYFSMKFIQSSRDLYHTVDDMMKLAREEKLLFEPGSKWQYSNTGFLVLGAVVEKVSGQSYYDYVRENIYRPAGMINSDCYELDHVNPNLAVGYEKEYTDNGIVFRNNIFSHVLRGGPQGGGYSTVEDLLKFDVALRSGKLVGKEYVKLLLSAKPELKSPQYGYGFQIDTEHQIAGHSGGFLGISSNLDMFLGNGYTAVVMSNYGQGSFPVSDKIQQMVLSGQPAQMSNR